MTVPEVLMPKMGDAMEAGTLSSWLKHEGDQVEVRGPFASSFVWLRRRSMNLVSKLPARKSGSCMIRWCSGMLV